MGCGCGGQKTDEKMYLVTTRDGKTLEVKGEFAARVEITRAGGGTYRVKG
jgi:hypothetical protein